MTSLFTWPSPDEYDPDVDDTYPALPIDAVLVARDRPHVSLRTAELFALPRPLQSESISSWVCRAAQSQGSPIPRFLDFLGWKFGGDLDLEVSRAFSDTSFLKDSMFIALEHARHLMVAVDSFSDGHQLLLSSGSPILYRYCPRCLREDPIPYFRQEWRLAAWRVCWTHSCFMEDQCEKCGAYQTLPLSMNIAAKNRGIGFLNECAKCGCSLSARKPLFVSDARLAGLTGWACTLSGNGRALVSALRTGKFCVDGNSYELSSAELPRLLVALLPSPGCPPTVAELRARLADSPAQPTTPRIGPSSHAALPRASGDSDFSPAGLGQACATSLASATSQTLLSSSDPASGGP